MSAHSSFPPLSLASDPTVTVSDDDLREAEAVVGVSLPRSYRDFAKTFGYGLLYGLYIVYVPMANEDSLAERNAVLRDMLEMSVDERLIEYKPDGSPELVRRLVPFGISENGDVLAWDPAEKTGDAEYAIYMVGPRTVGVARAASDLYEFVEKCRTSSERGSLSRRTLPMQGSDFKPLTPFYG